MFGNLNRTAPIPQVTEPMRNVGAVPGIRDEVVIQGPYFNRGNPRLSIPREPDYPGSTITGFAMQSAHMLFVNQNVQPVIAPVVHIDITPKQRVIVVPIPKIGINAVREKGDNL